MQRGAGFVSSNGDDPFAEHRAGIQPRIHLHNGHACFGITGPNAGLDRGSTPPARQQRGMHIDRAVTGNIQYALRQDLPEGGNDVEIRLPLPEFSDGLSLAELLWLQDWDAMPQRHLFDRRFLKLTITACRTVRLRDDPNNVMMLDQLLQRLDRKNRGSHKYDACHVLDPVWGSAQGITRRLRSGMIEYHASIDFILNGLIICVYAPQTLVAGKPGTP